MRLTCGIKKMCNNRYYLVFGYFVGVITLLLFIVKIIQVNSGLDTLHDEGYLLLKLWEVGNDTGSQGVSQWAVLVNRLLGIPLSLNLLFLRYSGVLIQLVSVSFLAYVFYLLYFKSKNLNKSLLILYFSFIFLIQYSSFSSLIIHYNQIQQALFVLMLVLVLVFSFTSRKKRSLLSFIFGVLSLLSILNILPSGVIVSMLVLMFLFSVENFKFRVFLNYLSYYLLGILSMLFVYHFFINDLFLVVREMKETADTITGTNRGYDIWTFIIRYVVYIKDIVLVLLPLLVAAVLSFYISKSNKMVATLLLLVLINVIYFFYPWNKALQSTLILFPAILSFAIYVFSDHKNKSIVCLLVFLLMFPFAGLLGTNVYYGSKITWFMVSWVLIPLIVLSVNSKSKFLENNKSFLILLMSVLYLYNPLVTFTVSDNNGFYFHKYDKISKVKITESQLNYFNRVDSLLDLYDYKPNTHYILAMQLDHMTIFSINARPNSTYFQPMDFVEDNTELVRPDFIFLTKYDLDVAGSKLEQINWGFPEMYDRYFVGTPETIDTGYPTERWLYCRKNIK